MKKHKRRHITLIEVLLSFGLIAVIVGSLLMYLRRIIFLQAKLQIVEREVLSRAHIQQQLHYLFSHLEYGKDGEFFTILGQNGPELHFSFDNKIDVDRSFSGRVNGIIRSKDGQLVVEIRPLITDPTTDQGVRECVIAGKVDSVGWCFLSFDETSNNQTSSEVWPRDKNSYPDIFSLILKSHGTVHTFPVFLFKDFSGISYKSKGDRA